MTDSAAGATRSALRAAAANRCPNCGGGRLTLGYLRPADACAACGADFKRHAAGDGAVFIVLTALCVLVMAVVVALEFAYRPPLWAHGLVGLGLTFSLTALLLPPVKRFMIAQSFVMEARGEGDGDPR